MSFWSGIFCPLCWGLPLYAKVNLDTKWMTRIIFVWCGTRLTQHTRLMLLTFKCTVLFVCLFDIQQETFNCTFTRGYLQAIPLSFTLAILQCMTCSHASWKKKKKGLSFNIVWLLSRFLERFSDLLYVNIPCPRWS